MKKFLALLLTLALVLGVFAGCTTPSSTNEDPPEANNNEQNEPNDAPNEAVNVDDIDLPVDGIGRQITTDVKANDTYKIACIVKNSTNPYMAGCLSGVEEAARQMGFEAILMAPATNDSVEEQVKIMEDLIQSGVDGFVLVPVDTNGIMPGVRKAEEANIPVAVIGTPAATETFLRTGVDYTETGRVIAKEVAEKIGGEGQVIIIEGPPGAQNAIERLNGINEVLATYPGIEVVASQTANFKRTEGMSVTENLLQKYSDISAIIAANDESAIGAYQAVSAAGLKDVVIAGFDGNQDGSAAILEGGLYASYNTDPFGSCFLAATYIVRYLNDGTMPEQYFIPFPSERDNPVIKPENVQLYIDEIAWW